MPNTILTKRTNTPSKVPLPANLILGEFAINTYDGNVFILKDDGTQSVVWVNAIKINGVTAKTFTFTYSDFSAASNTLSNVSVVDMLARGVASGLAPIASPAFLGLPTAPTPSTSDSSQRVATTSFVQSIAAEKAPISNPTFTGTPAAPTAQSGTNTTQIATTAFVQTEISSKIQAFDVMVFKGVIDCSLNPNYPQGDAGHTYRVSVAGKVGGASGINVEQNDVLICLADSTAAGTQAAVGTSWAIVQANIDGAVTSIESASADNGFVVFAGTSGKSIRQVSKSAIKTLLSVSNNFISNVSEDIILSSNGSDSGAQTEIKFRGASSTSTNTKGSNLKISAPNGTLGSGNFVFETSKSQVQEIITGTSSGFVSANANSVIKDLNVPAGNNRYLLVTVIANNTTKASAVTYAGAAMTLLEEVTSGVKTQQLWGLKNPTFGTNNIVATMTGSASVVVYGTAFLNVDQTTPIQITEKSSSSTPVTSASLSVSSTQDQLVYNALCTVSAAPTITGSYQKQLWTASGGGTETAVASSKLAIGSTTSASYSFASSTYTFITAAINTIASSTLSTQETTCEIKNHGVLAIGLDEIPKVNVSSSSEYLNLNSEHHQIFTTATTDSVRFLPNATKLSFGSTFSFANNQTTGNVIVKDFEGTTLTTIAPSFYCEVKLLQPTSTAGSWDVVYKLLSKNLGVANGAASLDSEGKVPASQLPAAQLGVSSVNGQSGNVVVDFVGDTKVSMRTANHGAWLLCNGQAVSRTIYSALFAVLGTTWGSGDGSTTFNLPNPAGRAIGIAGAGSGLTSRAIGTQIGTESHILSTAEMPSHSHSIQGYVRTDYDANDSFSNFNGLDTGGNNYNTTSVGGGGAHNNMQPTSFIGNLFVYSGVV